MVLSNFINVKQVTGLYFVLALTLEGSVNCANNYVYKMVEEVVSIYGENFMTPKSREPYFIKVHRCITTIYLGAVQPPPCWPMPKSQNEIEIVVADINNQRKFYKYVVYNHTSCKCGWDESKLKLHKKLVSNQVNETEFNSKLPNNPVNLRSCDPSTYCSKPQPVYIKNPYKLKALQSERLILLHQCFPGCKATEKKVHIKELVHGKRVEISRKTHKACAPYKKKPVQRPSAGGLIMGNPYERNNAKTTDRPSLKTEKTNDKESENSLLIYIASPKVILAALVLSVILVSILIVDFNLCHRKKGIMYSLLNCRKDMIDNACRDCADRQQKVIEVV